MAYPPTGVAPDELIQSAWGNDVVAAIGILNAATLTPFTMTGPQVTVPGAYDLFIRSGVVQSYPRIVEVWANIQFGFNGNGAAAGGGYITRMLDGAQILTSNGWAAQSNWGTISMVTSFAVPAGTGDGFKVSLNHTAVPNGGNNWQGGHGGYILRRIG